MSIIKHFKKYTNNPQQTKTEVLSGLTVAIALVPEAVAFAFFAHVAPLVGLWAACIVCFITSVFGGRPGMISGATGALAVVMANLVLDHGEQYLFATVILMGIIQLFVGIFKLGKFIRIVPYPVMLGFVNGLAIVIFIAQLDHFKIKDSEDVLQWMQGNSMYIMLVLVALTMAIIHFLPRFTKIIPSGLAAIIAIFGVVQLLGLDTRAVGDIAEIGGSFPDLIIPNVPLNLETLKIIAPYAFILAGIGLIESLLAMSLIDDITETHGRNSRECLAQGGANVVTGFFGGMGGCAMIGQSMINISSGARQRLSGIVAALCLMLFILYGSGIIELIPMAALVGVMFMVVIGTFAWSSLRIMHKIPMSDALVIVVVSALTVAFDLAIAVIAGVIIAALVYVWKSSQHITAVISEKGDTKEYKLYGPIFFGSISSFRNLFFPNEDPKNIIIDFEESRVWDHSSLEALEKLAEKYSSLGKNIKFRHLSEDCAALLGKVGSLVEIDHEHDPKYEVIQDRTHEPGSKEAI